MSQCGHGSITKRCGICERDKRIAAQDAEVERLREVVERGKNIVAALHKCIENDRVLTACRSLHRAWKREHRAARDYGEALENVCDAIGLKVTHWMVIGSDVADVVKERDSLRARLERAERIEAAALACFKVDDEGRSIFIGLMEYPEDTRKRRIDVLEDALATGQQSSVVRQATS